VINPVSDQAGLLRVQYLASSQRLLGGDRSRTGPPVVNPHTRRLVCTKRKASAIETCLVEHWTRHGPMCFPLSSAPLGVDLRYNKWQNEKPLHYNRNPGYSRSAGSMKNFILPTKFAFPRTLGVQLAYGPTVICSPRTRSPLNIVPMIEWFSNVP
jgi:hypothetical protein